MSDVRDIYKGIFQGTGNGITTYSFPAEWKDLYALCLICKI